MRRRRGEGEQCEHHDGGYGHRHRPSGISPRQPPCLRRRDAVSAVSSCRHSGLRGHLGPRLTPGGDRGPAALRVQLVLGDVRLHRCLASRWVVVIVARGLAAPQGGMLVSPGDGFLASVRRAPAPRERGNCRTARDRSRSPPTRLACLLGSPGTPRRGYTPSPRSPRAALLLELNASRTVTSVIHSPLAPQGGHHVQRPESDRRGRERRAPMPSSTAGNRTQVRVLSNGVRVISSARSARATQSAPGSRVGVRRADRR